MREATKPSSATAASTTTHQKRASVSMSDGLELGLNPAAGFGGA